MYKPQKPDTTTINVNAAYEGETIEEKVRRILKTNEPIADIAPRIYTERKDGALPEYNIKTDRFEVAIEAMDKVAKSKLAQREERHTPPEQEPIQTQNQIISKVEPTQATKPDVNTNK